MVDQLFGSKTRVKLLYLFYGNPNRSFYVREITRKIDEQINSVRRELANLLSIGILQSDNSNNKLYYAVNQKYEHYKPLSMMFGLGAAGGESAGGDEMELLVDTAASAAKRWAVVGNMELVVYTGALTRDTYIDVDIVVIGDVNPTRLDNIMKSIEQAEGFELRYAVFSLEEANYRMQVRDRFWSQLQLAKKQIIIDKQHFFEPEEEVPAE